MYMSAYKISLEQEFPGIVSPTTDGSWSTEQFNFLKRYLYIISPDKYGNFYICAPHESAYTIDEQGHLIKAQCPRNLPSAQQLFFDYPCIKKLLKRAEMLPHPNVGIYPDTYRKISLLHIDDCGRIWGIKSSVLYLFEKDWSVLLQKKLKGSFFAAFLNSRKELCVITATNFERKTTQKFIRVYRCVDSI